MKVNMNKSNLLSRRRSSQTPYIHIVEENRENAVSTQQDLEDNINMGTLINDTDMGDNHSGIDPYTVLKYESFIEELKKMKSMLSMKEGEFTTMKADIDQLKHKFEICKDLRADLLEIRGANNLFKNSIEKSKLVLM